jgi:hypothetical protein
MVGRMRADSREPGRCSEGRMGPGNTAYSGFVVAGISTISNL